MIETGAIKIGVKILDWLLKRKGIKTAQIELYLKEIHKVCMDLIEIEDPKSDAALLLHERIKVIQKNCIEKLPKSLADKEGWNLYIGLSSARIYYWLKVFDTMTENELVQLITERKELSFSLDRLIKIIPKQYDNIDSRLLEDIKRTCLSDIAKILEIRPFFS